MNCKYSANGSYSCSDNTMENIETIEKSIDYNRDYNLSYFGFKNLEHSYLYKLNKKRAVSITQKAPSFAHASPVILEYLSGKK